MSTWRRKFLIAGFVFIAAIILFAAAAPAGLLDRASVKMLCYVPLVLELLSTACFTVYTVTRPNTENWFPRTLAVVFVGGMLAFSWYAAWYVH